MADQRLRWNQIAAPDLSAASAAVARANTSFNEGFNNGSDILAQYGAAQQTKADDAILAEIAGLSDEAEFDAFIDGGGLSGRNLSEGMRDHILGLRGGLIDNSQGRADIRNTDARTGLVGAQADSTRANAQNTRATMGINLARESRTAADWQDGIASRDAARELAGQGAAAQDFASQYGNTVGGIAVEGATQDTRLMLARTLQMEAGNQGYEGMLDVGSVIRNRAASGRYGEGVEGVIMRPGQFSAWNGVTGYANGEQGQDTNFTPNDQALAAADAILSGNYQDRTGGATHYYAELPNSPAPSWTNSTFRQIDGDHFFGDADGVGAVNGNTGPLENRPAAGGTQTTERPTPVQEYRNALINSGQFSLTEINDMMADITGAADEQEQRLIAQDEAADAERRAAAILETVQNPEVLSTENAVAGLIGDETLPATERLGDAAALENAVTQSPALAGVLAPEVEADPRITGISDGISADLSNAAASTPQARMIGSIGDFAEDPTGTLISELNLGGDGQSPRFGIDSDLDDNRVTQMINEYARQFNVTDEVAAVAMREAFVRDPYGRNTLENRFPEAEVGRIIEDTLSQESISGYRADASRREQVNTQVNRINQQIAALQQQAAKGGDRTAIGQQIAGLMVQMSQIRADNAGLFGTPEQ